MIELDINRIVVILLIFALLYALYTYQQQIPTINLPALNFSKFNLLASSNNNNSNNNNNNNNNTNDNKNKTEASGKKENIEIAKEVNYDLISIDNMSSGSIGSLMDFNSTDKKPDNMSQMSFESAISDYIKNSQDKEMEDFFF
jgi:tRNA U34 5-carboxymethylaminomethyl modifying enzyme MnmG/GidA